MFQVGIWGMALKNVFHQIKLCGHRSLSETDRSLSETVRSLKEKTKNYYQFSIMAVGVKYIPLFEWGSATKIIFKLCHNF